MKVIQEDIWLCEDCTIAAVNDDFTGFSSEEQVKKTKRGLSKLGSYLVPDFNSENNEGIKEFSNLSCSCCNSHLAGSRHRFAILGQ